ncbi:MAG: hypothetical protein FJZ49_02685 [Candidatus Verstraetearchaeota archaeon]|nr:hypothetical protein [Candidatus Verstraetearchaeota archaeon]
MGILAFGVFLMAALIASPVLAGSYDQYGYNMKARIFHGTIWTRALAQFNGDANAALAFLNLMYPPGHTIEFYMQQKLIINWNAEWDRGLSEGWSIPPYGAWLTNELNGVNEDGSKVIWHSKLVWIGPFDISLNGTYAPDGGMYLYPCFKLIMDQGVLNGMHLWVAKALPNGLG